MIEMCLRIELLPRSSRLYISLILQGNANHPLKPSLSIVSMDTNSITWDQTTTMISATHGCHGTLCLLGLMAVMPLSSFATSDLWWVSPLRSSGAEGRPHGDRCGRSSSGQAYFNREGNWGTDWQTVLYLVGEQPEGHFTSVRASPKSTTPI